MLPAEEVHTERCLAGFKHHATNGTATGSIPSSVLIPFLYCVS